ncbi:MAG: trypsin-like peptidase domain-containing protein [Patescibacteria group bacterium]
MEIIDQPINQPIKRNYKSAAISLLSLLTVLLALGVIALGFLVFRMNVQSSRDRAKLELISKRLDDLKDSNDKANLSSQELQNKLNSISSNPSGGAKSNSEGNINSFGTLTKSIVKIYNISRSSTSSGTGTIIDNQGYILTNKHVIEESQSYFSTSNSIIAICTTKNPESKPTCEFTAEVIAIGDGDLDLALLKIDNKLKYSNGKFQTSKLEQTDLSSLNPFNIASNSEINPQLGSQINVLGYPGAGGDNISLTQGIYSGSVDEIYFKTDAKVNSGNSGGATFDQNNKFLGVPTAVSGGQGNIGYIIKAQQVINFINESI